MTRRPTLLRSTPGTAKPEQIATALENDIRSGVIQFGERLQSENELVQRFSVSRNTVRKGLEELSSRGLITTRVGIGSFVTFDGKQIDDSLGWSRALANTGAELVVRTLRLEVIEDPALAAALGLETTAFIAVDRLRAMASDGQGISIERSRLPLTAELEDVPLKGLREGSLQQTLRDAGLVFDHGDEWADIELVSAADAAMLACAPGTPFLRTKRIVRAADDRVIEQVVSLLNPKHFALHLEF